MTTQQALDKLRSVKTGLQHIEERLRSLAEATPSTSITSLADHAKTLGGHVDDLTNDLEASPPAEASEPTEPAAPPADPPADPPVDPPADPNQPTT